MSGTFPATFTTTFPAAAPSTGGGWEGLQAILDDARQTAAAEAAAPPAACPVDGTPLETGPDGGLYCPFDGWRPFGLPPTGPSPWPRAGGY